MCIYIHVQTGPSPGGTGAWGGDSCRGGGYGPRVDERWDAGGRGRGWGWGRWEGARGVIVQTRQIDVEAMLKKRRSSGG